MFGDGMRIRERLLGERWMVVVVVVVVVGSND